MATEDNNADTELRPAADTAAEITDGQQQIVDPVGDEDDLDDEPSGRVDEELDAAQNDEERDALLEKRREERRNRRHRARERREQIERELTMLKRQNAELQQGLAAVRNTQHGAQLSQLDAAIQESADLMRRFNEIEADALSKGDGKTAVEARERATIARERARSLQAYKERAAKVVDRPSKTISPETQRHGIQFLEKHKGWFKGPESNDPESRIVGMIDNQLAAEGWNSDDPGYWAELESRSARYLPHRFGNGKNPLPNNPDSGYNSGGQTTQRGSPVAGSTRSSVSTGTQGGYKLSPERVQAMKDAGMWDDPVARDRMIKRYRESDAAARTQRAA